MLEDDNDFVLLAIRALRKLPSEPIVEWVANRQAYDRALNQSWDIALLDFSLPGAHGRAFNGAEALQMILKRRPDTPALVLSGTITVEQAVETLKAGAVDYISKDQLDRLAPAVVRAHRERQTKLQLERAGRAAEAGSLAGGIVHDVNNAIAPVSLALTMVTGLTDEDCRILAIAKQSTERASETLKQITKFIRGTGMEYAPVALGPLLEELLLLIRRTFPNQIEIRPKIAGTLPLVNGNETQLQSILMNLCVNARDALLNHGASGVAPEESAPARSMPAAHQRPLIEIEAQPVTLRSHRTFTAPDEPVSGRFIQISVSDNGPGMTPDIAKRIFEPFFTTKKTGTGFGLWNALTLVREHHGCLDLKTIPGLGSKFSVFLPTDAPARMDGASAASAAEMPRGNGRTVLLVDDEVGLLEITRTLLQSFDYHVFAAASESEAFSLFRDNSTKISVVLTDLMMPGIGGVALIRQMRRLEPAVKVVCITGANDRSELAEAKPAEVLSKPFSPEKLLTTLERVCG
jgi:signal transduction histidine kinase